MGKFMLHMPKEKSRILPEHLTDILVPHGNKVHELNKLQHDCSLQEGLSEANGHPAIIWYPWFS